MVDKKTISQIIAIKVTIVVVFIFLILPIYPFDVDCVTLPCPPELKSGFELIAEEISIESEEQVACIQIFDPVCTVGGQTFSNQCLADNAGETVLFKGECP